MRDVEEFFREGDLAMRQDPTSLSDYVALNRYQDLPRISVVTIVAPVEERQTFYLGVGQVGVDPDDHIAQVGGEHKMLYVTDADRLYAVNASDGTVRWCQQLQPTKEMNDRLRMRHHPPACLQFGTPRVANGVVYVCASGYGRYTCAFNAGDGSLLWRTPTDAWSVAIPFADYAVPVVRDGIVYNGTYALHEQDGTVLWRIAVDTRWLSLQALVDGTLYAVTQMSIYAINAQNGEVRWHYEPNTHMPGSSAIGGPLVVADHLLYVGTLGSVDHPENSRFCALDADTGTLRWQYPMGDSYVGAVIHGESIYVSSRDQHLYALQKHNGSLRWKYECVRPTTPHTVTIVGNIVYINIDGVYALNSMDGTILWHKDLERGPGFYCTQPVICEGVVYLVCGDGSGASILYALNASNGAENWHNHYPYKIALLAVAH
jgi:outer membrane protein assembly factor BamB